MYYKLIITARATLFGLTNSKMAAVSFLSRNEENGDYNQYWYSQHTIECIVRGIEESGATRIAFLSTPSLYFSIPEELRSKCFVFDVSSLTKQQQQQQHGFND